MSNLAQDTKSEPKLPPVELLIDGEWREAKTGKRFETRNPATGEIITTVAEAGRTDVHDAVMAARRAFETGPWATMPGIDRGRILYRIAQMLRDRFEEFVALESLDAGKPLRATRRQDLPAVIDCFEYYAGWADKLKGDVIPVRDDALTYTIREPVGVVAAIVPWNFPLMNAAWKIAPALACGCTIVLKPAELTPLSVLALGALALEAGLPPGVLDIIPGPGSVVGATLVAHPGINKISFTGSPEVGRQIMRAAADNVTRVGLELGGKSPNIIFEDADIEAAVRASSSGVFFNAGQVCSAGSRILVHRSRYDDFVDAMVKRAEKYKIGDVANPEVDMGPVISEKQMNAILGFVDAGRREGASLLTGGLRVGDRGYFLSPAVFANVDNDMTIAREEIFGPVASVIRFDDEEEAIRLANSSIYSLAAALWSRDVGRVHSIAKRLRAGTVWVNTYGHTNTRLPWGGQGGASGITRDLGEAALSNYTEPKAIWVNLGR